MKKLARSIADGKPSTIAKRSLALPSVKWCIARLIGQNLRAELKFLCADTFPSVHRNTTRETLERMSLDPAFNELSQYAPLLTAVLMESCPAKKDDDQKKLLVVTCTVAMLKFRNPKMKLLPSIFSLVLQAGNAGRQVNFMILVLLFLNILYYIGVAPITNINDYTVLQSNTSFVRFPW